MHTTRKQANERVLGTRRSKLTADHKHQVCWSQASSLLVVSEPHTTEPIGRRSFSHFLLHKRTAGNKETQGGTTRRAQLHHTNPSNATC